MEVEDEDAILKRLFFKRFGRALPEEKEKESDVDNINFVIDLTDEKDEDEMEVATSEVPVAVVKTEPIDSDLNESAAAKVIADRKERRELVKARKALITFGKTLRKTKVIPEKEAPEVVADSNVSEDTSVNVKTAEQAERDADEKEFEAEFGDVPLDEFDGTGSEFRLYGPEDVLPSDDEDAMIDNV
jgi:glutamate synthase domain-containing protein 1